MKTKTTAKSDQPKPGKTPKPTEMSSVEKVPGKLTEFREWCIKNPVAMLKFLESP